MIASEGRQVQFAIVRAGSVNVEADPGALLQPRAPFAQILVRAGGAGSGDDQANVPLNRHQHEDEDEDAHGDEDAHAHAHGDGTRGPVGARAYW